MKRIVNSLGNSDPCIWKRDILTTFINGGIFFIPLDLCMIIIPTDLTLV